MNQSRIIRRSYKEVQAKHLNSNNYLLVVASLTVPKLPRGVLEALNYDFQEFLAPSKDLLDHWNSGKLSQPAYSKRYYREQRKKNPRGLAELEALSSELGVTVVLLCWCKSTKFCHTRLLLEANNSSERQSTLAKSKHVTCRPPSRSPLLDASITSRVGRGRGKSDGPRWG